MRGDLDAGALLEQMRAEERYYPVLYLDTSALVKLIRIEAESHVLGDWLDERAEIRWITSAITEIELPRAIRAVAPQGLSSVPAVLARLDRFEIDQVIRSTAAAFPDPGLRSLDAVHLGHGPHRCIHGHSDRLGHLWTHAWLRPRPTSEWPHSHRESPVGMGASTDRWQSCRAPKSLPSNQTRQEALL